MGPAGRSVSSGALCAQPAATSASSARTARKRVGLGVFTGTEPEGRAGDTSTLFKASSRCRSPGRVGLSRMQTLETPSGPVSYWPLTDAAPAEAIARLPYVVRVFLENVLRHQGEGTTEEHVALLRDWPGKSGGGEFPFFPARVLLQDLTGVPAVADLAALRAAVARLGGRAEAVDPRIPVDLVIDHSVIVDEFGTAQAFARNVDYEYQRNGERYAFLRWAQGAFDNFTVVPPGAGIVHQVNLEFLGRVVVTRDGRAYPDTLLGTDSHTTMIGGLGVLGWGVGGIEAEAAMVGEPVGMTAPVVVGVK